MIKLKHEIWAQTGNVSKSSGRAAICKNSHTFPGKEKIANNSTEKFTLALILNIFASKIKGFCTKTLRMGANVHGFLRFIKKVVF